MEDNTCSSQQNGCSMHSADVVILAMHLVSPVVVVWVSMYLNLHGGTDPRSMGMGYFGEIVPRCMLSDKDVFFFKLVSAQPSEALMTKGKSVHQVTVFMDISGHLHEVTAD
jgi:hypothetical protein